MFSAEIVSPSMLSIKFEQIYLLPADVSKNCWAQLFKANDILS